MSLTCFGSVIWPFAVIVGEFIVINKTNYVAGLFLDFKGIFETIDRETLIKNITSFFTSKIMQSTFVLITK